jgi:ADP-ribosylglycohydrolase/uncharacterized protein YegL
MLLGAVIGDVIGTPYEGRYVSIKTTEFPLISERSRFSDDTVMTMAIAHALMNWEKGDKIDESEFQKAAKESMITFGRMYPRAGYSRTFSAWIHSPDPQPYGSIGNGAAMKVSPVAWYFDDLDTVERFAAAAVSPSHNSPEGIKGAQATAAAIFLARTGKSKDDIRNYISIRYGYDLNRTIDEIRPGYKFDATCPGSVPESIIAFLESDSFEDAVRKAVSLGGDADTMAAIAGSIAQGMYGVPEEIEAQVLPLLDDFLRDEAKHWDEALNGKKEDETPVEKVKNGITDMVFILDRSGSMGGLENDTIGGFNSMIQKQKEEPGEAYVSTLLFDDMHEVLHDRVRLSEIQPLTEKDYWVRGCTALHDAIGRAISHTVDLYRHMKPEYVPEKTVFTIITDGMENASHEYSGREIKRMIEHEKAKYRWEFLFIGANIDAITTAEHLGIDRSRSANYMADSMGTGAVFASVGRAMFDVRSERSAVSEEWCEAVYEDYVSRSSSSESKLSRLRDLFRRRKKKTQDEDKNEE